MDANGTDGRTATNATMSKRTTESPRAEANARTATNTIASAHGRHRACRAGGPGLARRGLTVLLALSMLTQNLSYAGQWGATRALADEYAEDVAATYDEATDDASYDGDEATDDAADGVASDPDVASDENGTPEGDDAVDDAVLDETAQTDESATEPTDDSATPDDATSPEATDDALASVVTSDDGPEAVNVHGKAAESRDDAYEALADVVSEADAERLASEIELILQGSNVNGRSGEASTCTWLDGKAADAISQGTHEGDGITIGTFELKWATPDDVDDGDDNHLSLSRTSDAGIPVIAEIDYSISGTKRFQPGEINIYVPATLFYKRGTTEMAGEHNIPYAAAPSRLNEFNWQLVSKEGGDYIVFTNTVQMSAATAGYIQVDWDGVIPHEVEDEKTTNPWYAYIEVKTPEGNVLTATTGNELTATMDTSERMTSLSKRVQSGYPQRVDNDGSVVPTDKIPENYLTESEFVVVDWYTQAHYVGNQPYSIDITDALDTESDGLQYPGFIFSVTNTDAAPAYSADGTTATVTDAYDGWPGKENGDTAYVHVFSAYPFSQFAENTNYLLNNNVTYTLTPTDRKDEATTLTKSASVTFNWHKSTWEGSGGGPGTLFLSKWGNDGAKSLESYTDRDMVAHNPDKESQTVSRRGANSQGKGYYPWYGIYDSALNKLNVGKDVTLWYTVYNGGLLLPHTLVKPANLVDGDKQWAKWDSATKQYVASSSTADTPPAAGYELVPYDQVLANYLQKPVTVIAEGAGASFGDISSRSHGTYVEGGVTLMPGVDYVLAYVELDKPTLHTVVGKETKESRSMGYAVDTVTPAPPTYIQVEVNGQWQQSSTDPAGTGDWYAMVDWSGGTPYTTYASGELKESAVVKLPEGCTNVRTVVTCDGIASFEQNVFPAMRLLPTAQKDEGEKNLKQLAADTFAATDGPKASAVVYNGATASLWQHDDDGAIKDQPTSRGTCWGEDRVDGYVADVEVYPIKEVAEFVPSTDVDYVTRQARVHYSAKVEERTFIPDRVAYEEALDEGVIKKETTGVWYDLLPKGMVLDYGSVTVRDGDTYGQIVEADNWRGTGRTLVAIPVTLTPTPTTYKEHETDATSYWEDAPSISFDVTMDLDTWIDLGGRPEDAMSGITCHNVMAFESGNDTLGTVEHHSGEPNVIDQQNPNNDATLNGTFSDDEKRAFLGISLEEAQEKTPNPRTTPSFAYGECTVNVGFPTAGRASLSKNVSVDNRSSWGLGTYDDVRDAWERGTYIYRLRMASGQDTKSKNLVIYDSLENYVPVEGNDAADIGAPRWRGTFVSVDTRQLEDAHCAPVVYYSTVDNLALTDPDNDGRPLTSNLDLSDTGIWVKRSDFAGDPSEVRAVAIDCSMSDEGTEFVLEPGASLSAYVTMRAPGGDEAAAYIQQDAHAYNDVCLSAYTTQADLEFTTDPEEIDFVHYTYTKVGLKDFKVPVTKKWADDNDRDGLRKDIDKVIVTLYANGVEAGPSIIADNTLELTPANNWSGTFEHIPYTDEKGTPITYRVYEKAEDVPEGYTAETTGSAARGYTVTNTHDPERTTVSATKTWSGGDAATRPASIDLQLLADGNPVASQTISPDEDGNWPTYTFTDLLKYRDGGTKIAYTVREIVNAAAYVTNVEEVEGGYDITNTYHPYGNVSITKDVLLGTPAVAGKRFDFVLTLEVPLKDEQGRPVRDDEGRQAYEPLTGSYSWESSVSGASPSPVTDNSTISLAAGETVTIKELPNGTRVTFTEKDYSGVGFTTSEGRSQTTTVRQNQTRTVTATNIYHAKGQADLTAAKELVGAPLKASKYDFQVVERLDDGTEREVAAGTNDADGTVTFGPIAYIAADSYTVGDNGQVTDGCTYRYYIRERVPADAINASGTRYADADSAEREAGGFALNGVTYDTHEMGVTVTVRDTQGNGKLDVTVTYDQDDRTFTNTFEAKGTTSLTAYKRLETGGLDRTLQAGEFDFELVAVGGQKADGTRIAATDVPMPANPLQGNDARGVVSFGDVELDQDDVGNTYWYVAREVAGTDGTVEYDGSVFGYRVTVALSDAGDGSLAIEQAPVGVTVGDGGAYVVGDDTEDQPVFVNRLKPGSLRIQKLVDGESPDPEQEFDFLVVLDGEDVVPDTTYEFTYDDATRGTSGGGTPQGAGAIPSPLRALADLFAPTEARADDRVAEYSGTFGTNNSLTWEYFAPEEPYVLSEDTEVVSGKTYYERQGDAYVAVENPEGNPSEAGWYEDGPGELVIRPTVGNTATWSRTGVTQAGTSAVYPWSIGGSAIPAEKIKLIKKVTFKETINVSGSLRCLINPEDSWGSTATGRINCETIDVSGLRTTGVTDMFAMFGQQYKLKAIVGLDKLDTKNVTNMRSMFNDCPSLTDLDLTNFNTSKVTTMYQMFRNCESLTNLDLTSFNTSKVTDMEYMFYGCRSLTELDVTSFDTSKVTDMQYMFYGCSSLTNLNVTSFDTSKATNMDYMFCDCSSLTNLDVTGFNTSKVTNISGMFANCSSLTDLDVTHFNTSRVTQMNHMFYGCSSLTDLDVTRFNTQNVTAMYSLFHGCSSLTDLDVTGFDTSKVTSMLGMFEACSSLTDLDVTTFDTSKVTNMYRMFSDCSSLTELDLHNFACTPNSSYAMFDGCTSLERLDISSLGIDSSRPASSYNGMFGEYLANEPEIIEVELGPGEYYIDWVDHYHYTDHLENLSEVVLGPTFNFVIGEEEGWDGNTYSVDNLLPPVPDIAGHTYTGRWVRVDAAGDRVGPAYTPEDLAQNWNSSLAGIWVWEEGSFTVGFDNNGGTGTMADVPVTSSEPFSLSDLRFESPDALYDFGGWATSPDGDAVLSDGESVSVSACKLRDDEGVDVGDFVEDTDHPGQFAITLYAKWVPVRYNLVYEANGGAGSMPAEVVTAGEDHVIPKAKFYQMGQLVTGWTVTGEDADGNPVSLDLPAGGTIPAGTFGPGTTVTATAKWGSKDTNAGSVGNKFNVTLKGGEAAVFTDQFPAGTTYKVYEDTPDGWVLVSPASGFEEGTIRPTETSVATFTNRYDPKPDPDVTVTLGATKQLLDEGGDAVALGERQFVFQLRDVTDGADRPLQTVRNDAAGVVAFRPLGYALVDLGDADAKTFTYTITEIADSDEGMEYASEPVTATVTVRKVTDGDTGDVTLVADGPTYDPADATFVNRLVPEPDPVTHTLKVTKVAADAGDDVTFSFDVTLADAQGVLLPVGTALTVDGAEVTLAKAGKLTVNVSGEGSISIGGLPDGTTFSVTEANLPAGWSLASSEGTAGTLEGEEPKTAEATFTNEYAASGLVTLKAQKVFEGGDLTGGEFEFALYASAADAEADANRLWTASNGPAGADGVAAVTFGPLELTAAGDYAYIIREVPGSDETVAYDDATVTATFTMTDNGDGTLVPGEVSYTPTATFTNGLQPGSLAITKTLEGTGPNMQTAAFSVTVTLTDEADDALEGTFPWTSDRGGSGTVESGGTLTVHPGETITISGIPAGTRYAVAEDEDAAEAAGFALIGTDGCEGAIVPARTSEATVTNTFLTGTTATIEAHKVMEGRKLKDGETYTFELHEGGADGTVIATAENDADGNVAFEPLAYAYADAGKTFSYTVTEAVPDEAHRAKGVTYDESAHGVEVKVTKADDGTLGTEVTYADGAVPTFTNKYEATATARIQVTKDLVGADLATGQFSFTLERPNRPSFSCADARGMVQATNGDDGTVDFGEISFNQDDIGERYSYAVNEPEGGESGVSYDKHGCTVYVDVSYDAETDEIVTTVDYVGATTFVNTVLEPAKGEVSVEKELLGRDWTDGDEFAFTIEADKYNPDTTAVPRDADGQAVGSITVDGSEAVSFGTITFRKPGSYQYKVREVAGDLDDVVYDTQTHVVTIVVTDDGQGHLVARDDSSLTPAPVRVTNTYDPGYRDVTVTKAWDDADNQDGCRPASVRVQLLANGTASGEPVELSASNDWTYTWKGLHERKGGVEIAYTVEEVTDSVVTGTDGPGTYGIAVTGDMAGGFTITNKHTPELTSVSVRKAWDDKDDKDGIRPASVVVRLLADGKAVGAPATLFAANGWANEWSGLPAYADGQPVAYTVEEVTDSVVTGTDGPGTYAIAVTGDAASGFVVTNTHTPKTPGEPDKPTTPGKPTVPSGGRLPQTGDPLAWAQVGFLAAFGLATTAAGFAVRRRRRDD